MLFSRNTTRVSNSLGPDHVQCQIWVQTLCKGYEQTTQVEKDKSYFDTTLTIGYDKHVQIKFLQVNTFIK